MSSRNLRALLIEATRESEGVDMPADLDRRLRSRLFETARPRPIWVWGAAAGLAMAVLLVWATYRSPEGVTIDGLIVRSPSADLRAALRADRVIEVSEGNCTLVDAQSGEQIAVVAPALLRRDAEGLRVVSGTVELSVRPRPVGTGSLQILVSHGAIEIVGTRFTVVQDVGHGSVTLHEGEIRFHDASGGLRPVARGQRLEWPPAVAPAVEPGEEPPAPAPAPKVKRTPKAAAVETAAPIVFRDPEDLLQQVDVLRSRGLYAEAARYLTHGLTTPLRPATRERFSYELGSILTYQLEDPRAACTHWADHGHRYPAGRYQSEVRQASIRAGCEGRSP